MDNFLPAVLLLKFLSEDDQCSDPEASGKISSPAIVLCLYPSKGSTGLAKNMPTEWYVYCFIYSCFLQLWTVVCGNPLVNRRCFYIGFLFGVQIFVWSNRDDKDNIHAPSLFFLILYFDKSKIWASYMIWSS